MKALLVIDYINEIVNEKGKLSGKGYASFIEEHDTFNKVNKAIEIFRHNNVPIIFVKLGFKPGYENQPKTSPVFGRANEFGILVQDTWSTEFHETIDIVSDDVCLTKTRVSAFFKTGLDRLLQEMKVDEVCIAAVATDLAGEAAARSAHDLDYKVTVLADACAAANNEDHEKAISLILKIGSVINVNELKF